MIARIGDRLFNLLDVRPVARLHSDAQVTAVDVGVLPASVMMYADNVRAEIGNQRGNQLFQSAAFS